MEQLNFKPWGVEKYALYDNDGIALLSTIGEDEYGELFDVAHSLLTTEEDYSLFQFSGTTLLLSKDTKKRLLVCVISPNSPSMKAVHFLPEIHSEIAATINTEQ